MAIIDGRVVVREKSENVGESTVAQDWTHKELANHVYGLIRQNVIPIDNWGFYLFDSDFDEEQELRNKIGAVWLGSLYDSIEAQEKLVPALRKRVRALGLDHFDDVLNLAEAIIEVTKDVLALYTREEQIFILDFRNQLVHAWLDRRLKREVAVKFYDAGFVKRQRLTHKEFADIIRQFYEAGLDSSLKELIERFRREPVRYWNAVRQIMDPSKDVNLRRIVYSGLDENPRLRPGDLKLTITV